MMIKSRNEQTLGEKYLEILQGNQLKERGLLDSWNSLNDIDQGSLEQSLKKIMGLLDISKDHEEQLRDSLQGYLNHKLPTKYELPLQYSVLMDIAGKIEQSCARITVDKTKIPKPIIGSMFTGSLNACTQVVPGGDEEIIIFDIAFMDFIKNLCNVIASFFMITGSDTAGLPTDKRDIAKLIESRPEIYGQFRSAIFYYLFFNASFFADMSSLPSTLFCIAREMQESMELFLMGHEYGHIMAGHFDPLYREKISTRYNPDWAMEFEADNIGLGLMLDSRTNPYHEDLKLSLCAVEIILHCEGLITSEKNKLYKKLRLPKDDSHPPAEMRIALLKQFISNMYQDQPDDSCTMSVFTALQTIDDIFDFL
jgi:hypothetical protein